MSSLWLISPWGNRNKVPHTIQGDVVFLISFEWTLDCIKGIQTGSKSQKLKGKCVFLWKESDMLADEKLILKKKKTEYQHEVRIKNVPWTTWLPTTMWLRDLPIFPKATKRTRDTVPDPRPHLELDSRRRLCWSTEVAGLMLGVAQRDVLRSHWSSNLSSSSSVGPPTSWENTASLPSLPSEAHPATTRSRHGTYPSLRFCSPCPWPWSGPTSECCRSCGPWTGSAAAGSPSCSSPHILSPWTTILLCSQQPGSHRFCRRRGTANIL